MRSGPWKGSIVTTILISEITPFPSLVADCEPHLRGAGQQHIQPSGKKSCITRRAWNTCRTVSGGPESVARGVNQWRSGCKHRDPSRSEEHTSELQSLAYLVCR